MQRRPQVNTHRQPSQQQKRTFYVEGEDALKVWTHESGSQVVARSGVPQHYLAVQVDRTLRRPTILAAPTGNSEQIKYRVKAFPYKYLEGPDKRIVQSVVEALQLDSAPPAARASATSLVNDLTRMFKDREAISLETYLNVNNEGKLGVCRAALRFDDSARKSSGRQEDLQQYRRLEEEDPDEVEAAKDGIVLVRLDDPEARIGTLINGAGLAMNAVDALSDYGARSTNFLDTGGKATSDTVKKSFELLLKDHRVKVIFVNIFGGLTLCDMIANGIMMAFKDLDMKIPVVVRLRGTNEEKGQKMVSSSSGLLYQHRLTL